MTTTKLTGKETVAKGTMLFRFAKPAGFAFAAGQTIDLTLIEPKETDAEGNFRTFSITAAPSDPELAIATRMRDTAFKRTLGGLSEGSEISLDGPFGSFTLHENASRPAAFLAGGIGITPFRSMIRDAAARGLPHELYLFYSNRRPEDSAFLAELASHAKAHPQFHLVATMTDMEKSAQPWDGEQDYIDAAMLARHVPRSAAPVYYLAGPPAMVTALREMLKSAGISGDDIRFEDFAGY